MAEGTIAGYNLGKVGVVVDKSLVHAEDGELTSAQNAIHDKHGSDGGICNREGLVKYHSSAASGSILGFTGASLGPGPGTTTDDATIYFVARDAGGWFKSTDSFATETAIDASVMATVSDLDPTSAMWNNRMYYITRDETDVRVFDGVKDALFVRFDTGVVRGIAALNGELFVSTTTNVYAVDEFGRLEQMGVSPGSARHLGFHQNDLYVEVPTTPVTVYRVRRATITSTTAWTLDFTSAANFNRATFASFQGLFYAALGGTAAVTAAVYQRSAAGVYSSVDAATSTATDATSLMVYQGRLYVVYAPYNSGTGGAIRRTSDGTTWANVATALSGNATTETFYNAGSKLFSIQPGNDIIRYSATGASGDWSQITVASALDNGFGFFKASGSGPANGATNAFTLIQSDATLQLLNAAGTLSTLTLPTGVTLDVDRPPRFTVFDRQIVLANTPSRPVTIDKDGIVRPLSPLPPSKAISLDDDGGAGGLTGDYLARQTYIIRDSEGNLLAESDMSPANDVAFTAAADTLDAEGLNLSPEDVTGSRIYRTVAGGTTYFPWIDVDGNVSTQTQSVSDDTADAALSLVAAPELGTAPNLALVATWRGRLWGVDRADVDHARYSETGQPWAWPRANDILIGREGADLRGITAILARRDAIGFGRRESINQITGTSARDFRSVVLTENCGVESQETVCVYKDTAYFLWKDGVYTWDSSGIKCISDKKVRTWFVSDSYFNRARFPYAFACVDPVRNKYCLFLTAAGDSAENRWVEYDMDEGTWWGPHKTDAFTPVSAGISYSTTDRSLRLIGSSSGFLWKDQSTRTDNTATAISMSVDTKRHDGGTPTVDKVWGNLTMSLVPQTGGVLTITPSVGELNASASSQVLQAELSDSSYNAGRLGIGKSAKLNFAHAVAGRLVQILGYELNFFEAGQR